MSKAKKDKIKPGKYQHYKGKYYKVLSLATHSESLEKLVVYQQLYGDYSIWVRPFEMFTENIQVDNKTVKRFSFVSDK